MKYIGMTKRKFKERIKERKADSIFYRPSTALSLLNYKQNTIIDFDQTNIIYPTSYYYTSIIREPVGIMCKSNQV